MCNLNMYIFFNIPVYSMSSKKQKRVHFEMEQNITAPSIKRTHIRFDEDDKIWIDGTIYDPKTGKEYSCKAEMKKNNVLEVRGYIGVSIFGRTDTWTRMVKK